MRPAAKTPPPPPPPPLTTTQVHFPHSKSVHKDKWHRVHALTRRGRRGTGGRMKTSDEVFAKFEQEMATVEPVVGRQVTPICRYSEDTATEDPTEGRERERAGQVGG